MARRPGRAARPRRREALQPRGRPALGPPPLPLPPPPARRRFRVTPPEAPARVSSGGAGSGAAVTPGYGRRGGRRCGCACAERQRAAAQSAGSRELLSRPGERWSPASFPGVGGWQGSAARLFRSVLVSCCKRGRGLSRCSSSSCGWRECRGLVRAVRPGAAGGALRALSLTSAASPVPQRNRLWADGVGTHPSLKCLGYLLG